MIRRTMEFEDESELSAAAQAVAMARELKKVADAAPDGHVLAVVEMATLEVGPPLHPRAVPGRVESPGSRPGAKGGRGWPAPAAGTGGATARRRGGSSPPPAM